MSEDVQSVRRRLDAVTDGERGHVDASHTSLTHRTPLLPN